VASGATRGARVARGQPVRATAPAAPASIESLQKKFGIPGSVEFVPGNGGLPTVLLKHSCGASAQVWVACVLTLSAAPGARCNN
jgi:glucose-6-phosphate 1-epimerase